MLARRHVKEFCAFFGIVGRKLLLVSGGYPEYGERDGQGRQSREVEAFCVKANMICFVAFLTSLGRNDNPWLYGKFVDMILHLKAAYVSLFYHFHLSIEDPGSSNSAGPGIRSHCIFNRHDFYNKIAFVLSSWKGSVKFSNVNRIHKDKKGKTA